MNFIIHIFLSTVVLASAGPAGLASQSTPVELNPTQLKWEDTPPRMPKGAKMAVISGNATEKGPFVIRLKLPAGYKYQAHSHTTRENITVLSGNYNYGIGDKFDAAKGKPYPAGSYIGTPPGTNHFVWTTSETVIQIHGLGPFGTEYVNPADDPRNASPTPTPTPPAKAPPPAKTN